MFAIKLIPPKLDLIHKLVVVVALTFMGILKNNALQKKQNLNYPGVFLLLS